ncbi:MAG TPA: protein phosphatase 2C domain-containing protein [Propionicimonas sp.]|nr:protein phosphatase 2C domain-containing protein [Propionicimonas sp.]HRA05265.1 protein phosphatase 2C domain-containing protein [Propionicimonas sp.]
MTEIQLVWGSRTDTGLRRKVNEDALIADYPVFLVADGMGGHEAGDEASELALSAFRRFVGQPAVELNDFAAAFAEAVRVVGEISSGKAAAGTTISGVAVSNNGGATYWLVINIGDSRTYRLSGGQLEQISVDHSAVQELIDAGRLLPSEAERHPERHVITKAVGAGSRAEPDYWLIPARSGDRLLVCSDGLSKELDNDQIATVLLDEFDADAAATRLVHEALLHGGKDNVTVVVVDAQVIPDDDFETMPGLNELDVDTVPRLPMTEGASDG